MLTRIFHKNSINIGFCISIVSPILSKIGIIQGNTFLVKIQAKQVSVMFLNFFDLRKLQLQETFLNPP